MSTKSRKRKQLKRNNTCAIISKMRIKSTRLNKIRIKFRSTLSKYKSAQIFTKALYSGNLFDKEEIQQVLLNKIELPRLGEYKNYGLTIGEFLDGAYDWQENV